MKQHLVLWVIALFAVLIASLVFVSRQTTARSAGRLDGPDAAIERALLLLDSDINALLSETQQAVRVAAVYADNGVVNTAEAAYLLARQYEREQNFQGSEGSFKKSIGLAPDWSWPYAGLGSLLVRHSFGRGEEAKEALAKAISLEPEWGLPYGILAVLLRAEGRIDEALAPAELALRYMPNDISPLNNYANLLLDLKRYDEAEEYFRQAIDSFPDHPKPYYNLACLFAITGRADEALANLSEAFKRSDALRLEALGDGDLASLHDDPRFDALVHRGDVTSE